jgi:hypothetical protein
MRGLRVCFGFTCLCLDVHLLRGFRAPLMQARSENILHTPSLFLGVKTKCLPNAGHFFYKCYREFPVAGTAGLIFSEKCWAFMLSLKRLLTIVVRAVQ